MTEDYPKILWVCPKKQGYNAHEQQYKLPDDVKYIHHTTHEAALQALKVAREGLLLAELSHAHLDIANSYSHRVACYKQALEQINKILGDGE